MIIIDRDSHGQMESPAARAFVLLPRRRLPIRALAAVALSVATVAVAQDEPDRLRELASQAVQLHEAGNLEAAVAAYRRVLEIAPTLPAAPMLRSNLGAALAALNQFDEAIVEYRIALAGVDEPSIRANLVRALEKAGRLTEAADEATALATSRPGDREALLLLARLRMMLGQNDAVVDLLQPVAASSNDKATAYLLGSALIELGRTAEAQAVMDRLFRDDSPESHLLLGAMYAHHGRFAEAAQEFDQARAAAPAMPQVNYLYGDAAMKGNMDWAAAAAAFRAELAIDRHHFGANLMLGTLLREEGQHAEAASFLEHASRLRPDHLGARFNLGAAYLATGRLDEARGLLESVAAAAPKHVDSQMQLAILYTRLGLSERAAEARAAVVRLRRETDTHAFSPELNPAHTPN